MKRKTALVTGASRGIGKAIALRFAQEGYHVVINCRERTDLLKQVCAAARAAQRRDGVQRHRCIDLPEHVRAGAHCLAIPGDVGDFAACEAMFAEAKAHFGTIDVLVNNAGISHIGLLQDMSDSQWRSVMATNLDGVFHCCKLAIPDMVAQKSGKIINITSVWGEVGASCEVAYSASKGAVHAMTKALAKELAPSGIQVNAIACGAIDTEMNDFLDGDELDALIGGIPAGRLGKPEEVADLAWQLAQATPYLTGQVITLDGGWI
ncbi:MAG: SDR family NAD(P)-dependent oxidoreductase [Lachnospiraceae bacterium]|jgi:3-oxoacyl-[acyl-carrier protein] reductase|nr:SDR family NAD(P)-dependent oxidoreductase [Lachnospiraceae bacterium]